MKRIYLFAAALLVGATVATSAAAQTTPVPRPSPAQTPAPRPAAPVANPIVPNSKIAFIDTTMFGDEKNGITKYVSGMKTLEREFQAPQAELLNLQNRLKAIADDITRMRAAAATDPRAIQAKQDEGERLQRDLKRKKEDADALFQKRFEVVIGPVSKEIGRALDQFAQRNGITTTLDMSKLGEALLTALPGTDVTLAFIADFNSRNPAPRP